MGEFQTVNMTAHCDGWEWVRFTARDPCTLSSPDFPDEETAEYPV